MPDFDWTIPYPSQRMPVLARNVVATSQPLAAQVGLQILREGGNAADAAVATAIAMTVLEPTTNGLGSDAFALAWFDGKLHGLNGSGRSPKSLAPSCFAGMKDMPRQGWDPVMVPGAASAWEALWRRFGRLSFGQLCKPTIDYARYGFPVAPLTAALWGRAVTKYKNFPEWGRTFLREGRPPQPGQIITLPDHATTLEYISASTGGDLYRGELARKIAAHAKSQGSAMTADDLASHQADWVEPIFSDYYRHRLYEIPPNGQGIVALMALGILKHFDLASLQPDCPDVIHLQIEAMKLAFRDAHAHVADPAHMTVGVEELLGHDYLESRARMIRMDRAQDFNHGQPKKGGTVLLCAADASGNMVSFIQSQYEGFGSGVVIPGTGIAMNNRGACFTLENGHPNQVAGGKRPYHTIIPGFVTVPWDFRSSDPDRDKRTDEPLMAFGVMGGFMQPQGHLQVFLRIVLFKQNPQAALDAPRWQVTTGLKVNIEPGYEPSLYEELRNRGHEIEIARDKNVSFGRGQAIYRLEDNVYCAASDLRADGQAVGY